MLNAEKYKDELKKIGEYYGVSKDGELAHCSYHLCKECIFNHGEDCGINEFNWLFEEYKESQKIKLTRFEYDFLNALEENKDAYLARDEDGELYLFLEEPIKDETVWYDSENGMVIVISKQLFSFIKWEDEEPYEIAEILENCEVIEE